MPKPNKGESHSDFINRCMGNSETNSKYPDKKQRYAVCQSMWTHSKASEWLSKEEQIEDKKNVKE